jgi:hypothetical protein
VRPARVLSTHERAVSLHRAELRVKDRNMEIKKSDRAFRALDIRTEPGNPRARGFRKSCMLFFLKITGLFVLVNVVPSKVAAVHCNIHTMRQGLGERKRTA